MAEYLLMSSPAWDPVYASQNGDGTGTFWANSFLPLWGRVSAIAEFISPGASPPIGDYVVKRSENAWQSTTWAINETGQSSIATDNDEETGTAIHPPHDSTLTTVRVYVQSNLHVSLPGTMPTIRVVEINPATGDETVKATAEDDSTDVSEFAAYHAIEATMSFTVNREKAYRVYVKNGTGTTTGMTAYCVEWEATSGGIFPG
jgi:hypothetical protein